MVSSKPDRTALRTELDLVVAGALAEDLGEQNEDVTTRAVIDPDLMGEAVVIARKPGVLSGSDAAGRVFEMIRPTCDYIAIVADGTRLDAGDQVARITGPLSSILIGERTALNFLQRLSGIASCTRRFVDAAGGRITILDTRKTTPTLRMLEKYAVRAGGASNHRVGLFDAILIKDNHIRVAGGVAAAVAAARSHRPGLPVEIEAETLTQVDQALAAGAETILVDNMPTNRIRVAVAKARGCARIEISGGVTLERIPELATTGADFVSVGALTHSAPAIDISFEIEPA
jgi:nicotinate-nucleotide pyrophosphorylase (carboxylating)